MGWPKKLTATSYAILAHLAVQDWSAFDLAKQMTRGLDLIWPRAESGIYEEPKHLVEQGLATVRSVAKGARSRAVYSITPKGRHAFRQWLGTPSARPQLESEALVKVMFGDNGSKEDLLATLEAFGAQARALRERLAAQVEGYLRDSGPFPERGHVIGLGARCLLDQAETWERWASWAAREVRHWPSARPRGSALGRAVLSSVLEAHPAKKGESTTDEHR